MLAIGLTVWTSKEQLLTKETSCVTEWSIVVKKASTCHYHFLLFMVVNSSPSTYVVHVSLVMRHGSPEPTSLADVLGVSIE